MAKLETAAAPVSPGLSHRWARVRESRLVRQNVVLFVGGLVAGMGGFVYHALAGRILGPALYGEVASLIALFLVGSAPTLIGILVLARYAANLQAQQNVGAIRYLMLRTSKLLLVPCVAGFLVIALLSIPGAAFLHLGSAVPIIWLGAGSAAMWQLAVPRGVLQGTQHFPALSLNLSLEMVVRTLSLVGLLIVGLSVSGAMIAVLIGVVFAYSLGLFSLRELREVKSERVQLRAMATFSLTAAAGTVGVLLLYNFDVILAKHYLDPHAAGIYGGLNKIETIVYFATLSVSQVLYPRVVEAIANDHHPGRLLLLSAGLMSALAAGALVVFALVPWLVVHILFGPAFLGAVPYIFPVGLIGLGLSLDNLLVQFFMAAHDRSFVPILAAGCLLQAILIVLFHATVGQVVTDVLAAIYALLFVLAVRCWLLMPSLHPDRLSDAA